ncbi:YdcF family protein [Klebsiella sp. RHBSTW-00484]|uniref:YdcF family protein n=1 Tax=unclassified Klebsiella TaxID=2608929 RepID=UPI0015E4D0C0|nr:MULTISPECIES: YdcF family protein [unclassified Klebsiella]MBA7844780.1 YdcF family protein [Klebsiella sp. RHBSTW-00465]QLO34697.1 YdcF family protein [Klebsiella sp. RHBSTW-00484]QLT74211.1 YdcF family protein [Klebsiella sp. RHBSTW-00464]
MNLKKTLLSTLCILIGLHFTVASANTTSSIKNGTYGYQVASEQRNSVHHYLTQAHEAYVKWDMPALEKSLKEAYRLAPWRLDILFSIAATEVWENRLDDALSTYDRILKLSPNDIDALTYQALYTHAQGKKENPALFTLKKMYPARASDLQKIFTTVENGLHTPVMDQLPTSFKTDSPTAIVTLGFALEENGNMATTLIDRLNKTLEVAKALPEAKIIVTGGVPKNNKNEGVEMKRWLTEKGIDPDRIIDENYARDTVENMIYSRYIVNELQIKNIVLISSGTHVRRGKAILEVLGWQNGLEYNVQMVAAPDKPLAELQEEGARTLGIYRDALRAFGLNMMRSAPELLEI